MLARVIARASHCSRQLLLASIIARVNYCSREIIARVNHCSRQSLLALIIARVRPSRRGRDPAGALAGRRPDPTAMACRVALAQTGTPAAQSLICTGMATDTRSAAAGPLDRGPAAAASVTNVPRLAHDLTGQVRSGPRRRRRRRPPAGRRRPAGGRRRRRPAPIGADRVPPFGAVGRRRRPAPLGAGCPLFRGAGAACQ